MIIMKNTIVWFEHEVEDAKPQHEAEEAEPQHEVAEHEPEAAKSKEKKFNLTERLGFINGVLLGLWLMAFGEWSEKKTVIIFNIVHLVYLHVYWAVFEQYQRQPVEQKIASHYQMQREHERGIEPTAQPGNEKNEDGRCLVRNCPIVNDKQFLKNIVLRDTVLILIFHHSTRLLKDSGFHQVPLRQCLTRQEEVTAKELMNILNEYCLLSHVAEANIMNDEVIRLKSTLEKSNYDFRQLEGILVRGKKVSIKCKENMKGEWNKPHNLEMRKLTTAELSCKELSNSK
ncbi:unnamed protein product [Mytilus coruscus]|uniref:Uncharacterized protein n=1 Tax=Mytilus coruscus TaxID=42192 RepID=A0A6J8CM87_MYTCO|nr:unnamed protein product [Mytilus coruscus]